MLHDILDFFETVHKMFFYTVHIDSEKFILTHF